MLLNELLANRKRGDKEAGDETVPCIAIHKSETSFNCRLTIRQAKELASLLRKKAQLISDKDLEDAVVHLWNVGEGKGHRMLCGLKKARKGLGRSE
jgi:hypothetical protein